MRQKTMFLVLLLGSFFVAISGAAAQSSLTWWQNLNRPVTSSSRTPPNFVRGLSYGSAAQIFNAIQYGACADVAARPSSWYRDDEIAYNGTVQFRPFQGSTSIVLADVAIPFICTTTVLSPTNTFAYSPEGEQFPAYIGVWANSIYVAELPIIAYAHPGLWTLATPNYQISVQIAPPDRPYYIEMGNQYLLGGFQPLERVVGVFVKLNYYPYEGEYQGEIALQMNEGGYALLDSSAILGDVLLVIGEFGSIIDDYPFMESQSSNLSQELLNTYWANASSLNPNAGINLCTRAPHDVLSGHNQGRVTPGDPNNIRSAPESGNILGKIPGGSQFNILGGPVCGAATNLRWWYVEYNGIVGWTADGRDGVPWLQPVVSGVPSTSRLCAGSPPPRLSGLLFAHVVYGTGPNNIRAGIESGTILGQIPEGGVFNILAGPVCGPSSYQQTWYQVEYGGIVGWTSEGYQNEYWLEP